MGVANGLSNIQARMCVLFNLAEIYNKVYNTNMMKKQNDKLETNKPKE